MNIIDNKIFSSLLLVFFLIYCLLSYNDIIPPSQNRTSEMKLYKLDMPTIKMDKANNNLASNQTDTLQMNLE